MAGTLVVGCGGPGRSSVQRLASEGYTCLTVDWTNADLELLPPELTEAEAKSDSETAERLLRVRRNEISLNMKGFSEVVLLTNLGGALGSVCIPLISECAKENDCRFIVVLTIPFAFEETRREAALAVLPSISSLADRTFVMDLQYSGVDSMVLSDALAAVDGLFCIAARTVSDLIGSIPFMSTFTDRMYSFSRGYGDTQLESLDACIRKPFFNVSRATNWKLVICSDGPVGDLEREAITATATRMNGALPQIIEGRGTGSGLTVFIPIFPTSPRT